MVGAGAGTAASGSGNKSDHHHHQGQQQHSVDEATQMRAREEPLASRPHRQPPPQETAVLRKAISSPGLLAASSSAPAPPAATWRAPRLPTLKGAASHFPFLNGSSSSGGGRRSRSAPTSGATSAAGTPTAKAGIGSVGFEAGPELQEDDAGRPSFGSTSSSSRGSVAAVGHFHSPPHPVVITPRAAAAQAAAEAAAATPAAESAATTASTASATSSVAVAPEEEEEEESWLRSANVTAEDIEAMEVGAENLPAALELLEALQADDRLIRAHALWRKVDAFLQAQPVPATSPVVEEARALLATPERQADLRQLAARAMEAVESMDDLEDKSGWVYDHTLFGTDTYRRYEDGQLYVMVDTLLDRKKYLNMTCFEPICVLKEAALYSHWSPYCTRNAVVRSYDGKGDLLNFILFDLRVIRREIFLRTFICDDSLDSKRLLIVGHTVTRASAEAQAAPQGGMPAECYHDCPPMTFHKLRALIQQEDGIVRVTIAAKMDLNTSIPRPVVDFAIRRFFQVLVYLIIRAAKAAISNPVHNCHARLIRRDPFYRRFLLPKYQALCARYGWAFPGIRALQVADHDAAALAQATAAAASSPASFFHGGEDGDGQDSVSSLSSADAVSLQAEAAAVAAALGHAAGAFEDDDDAGGAHRGHGHRHHHHHREFGRKHVQVKHKKKRRRFRPRKHLARFIEALSRVGSSLNPTAAASAAEKEEGRAAVALPASVDGASIPGLLPPTPVAPRALPMAAAAAAAASEEAREIKHEEHAEEQVQEQGAPMEDLSLVASPGLAAVLGGGAAVKTAGPTEQPVAALSTVAALLLVSLAVLAAFLAGRASSALGL